MRFLGVFALSVLTCAACAQVATLSKQPDLRHTEDVRIQAFPRVVANGEVPAPIADKINASLARFDAEVRTDAAGCAKSQRSLTHGDSGGYSRSITTTMTGPGFLSFFVEDGYECGGPHPDDSALALVYDLSTGSPVNWGALLPSAAKGEIIRSPHRLPIGVVHWPAMLRRARDLAVKSDADAACGQTYDDMPELIGFNVYLSAKDHALAMSPNLTPHIASAMCTAVVLIKPDEAKQLGVSATIVDALRQAQ